MANGEEAEAEGGVAEGEVTRGEGIRFLSLIPDSGREVTRQREAAEAAAIWSAVSTCWHPALLALSSKLPEVEEIGASSSPMAGEARVVPQGAMKDMPSGLRTQAEDAGCAVIEATGDRGETLGRILESIRKPAPEIEGQESEELARDYLALGMVRWWLKDLTIGMGHADCLDLDSLSREALEGARCWARGDLTGASSRLRASFEVLTQARERVYPIESYILDVCLLDKGTEPAAVRRLLEIKAPITFLVCARAIEVLAQADGELIARILEGVNEGWIDIVGGCYEETDEALRPVESVLWQYRKGSEVYRKCLEERTAETVAHRRFGLYPRLPQLAKRFGFRYAVHWGLDGGRFPTPPESKRLWESPDKSYLESLMRVPMAVDREDEGLKIAWRVARSMKNDQVATLPMTHWPEPIAAWVEDLRRMARYSPVLGRCLTLGDYFHQSDRPFESYRPELDKYVTPYLSQAVESKEKTPISGRVERARWRVGLASLQALDAVVRVLDPGQAAEALEATAEGVFSSGNGADGLVEGSAQGVVDVGQEGLDPDGQGEVESEGDTEAVSSALVGRHGAIEDALEVEGSREVVERLENLEAEEAAKLARIVEATAKSERPGYLVFNMLPVMRRVGVPLPGAEFARGSEGPLKAAQLREDGLWGVVEVPAFGYAWVPRLVEVGGGTAGGEVQVEGYTLRNRLVEVAIDEGTGGLRAVRATGGDTWARLGQQLVVVSVPKAGGLVETVGRMSVESIEVEQGGPALAEAISRGVIKEEGTEKRLACYEQRVRLWWGRPIVEIEVSLTELEGGWLERLGREGAEPWAEYLACRWAWPDGDAELRRTSLLAAFETEAQRPETPDALDITARGRRTTLLFGGLAHHRRQGQRMLDTLLVAGREQERRFRLGVALDVEHPHQAALDFQEESALVVPTEKGPPGPGQVGWFFHVDGRGVVVTRVEAIEQSGNGRGWGLILHVQEVAGKPVRCRLRMPKKPIWARQIDYNDELILDLGIEGDAVSLDLTPYELARVDVTMG